MLISFSLYRDCATIHQAPFWSHSSWCSKMALRFQTSFLTSYSSEEETASLQISSVERRGNFSFLEDLSKYLPHILTVFLWLPDFPWTNCRDQGVGFTDWFKAIGLSFPYSYSWGWLSAAPSEWMGNCARKLTMTIPCKSPCKLPLWLAWCALLETSKCKFSQFHQIDLFPLGFLFELLSSSLDAPQLVYWRLIIFSKLFYGLNNSLVFCLTEFGTCLESVLV